MTIRDSLAFLAGIIFLIGFTRYGYAILKSGKKPATASWIIWSSLDYVLLYSSYLEDTVTWQLVAATIGTTAMALISLRYGKKEVGIVDLLCLLAGAVGVVIAVVERDARWAMFVILAVIFLGGIPTWVSTYKHPEREDKAAWVILLVSCIFAVAAVQKWTLKDAAQPVSFLASEIIMVILLFRPRRTAATA